MPIHNDQKKVLGVAQLIKTQKETFNDVDIGTLEVAFAHNVVHLMHHNSVDSSRRGFQFSLAWAFTIV